MERKVREVLGALPGWAQLSLAGAGIAVVVIAVPMLLTAGLLLSAAWWLGWPATRLRNVVIFTAAAVVVASVAAWDPLGAARTWWAGVRDVWNGQWYDGVVQVMALELLAGTLLAYIAWWRHCRTMLSGAAMQRGERHAKRARRHRDRSAATRARHAPTPLTIGTDVVIGQLSEESRGEVETLGERLIRRHRWPLVISERALRHHMALIGQTGVGKTVLARRLTTGGTQAAWREYVSGTPDKRGPRPLTIFVDCKGDRDAASDGAAWCDAHIGLGLDPRRVGLWPFEDRLDMWGMPADELQKSLHALAKTEHRYYDVLQRGLLHLVIDAPSGQPRSSLEFLERFSPEWLAGQWAGHPVETLALQQLTSGPKTGGNPLGSDLLLFDDLLRQMGGDFDAGRPLSDFDALYCSVPGARDSVRAAAKVQVLIELLTYSLQADRRRLLFMVDEYSAVSDAVSLVDLVERIRSFGGGLICTAQSYQGLGPDDDSRERLLNAMGGGMLVMRTAGAEPLAKRAGTRRVGEVGRKVEGTTLGDEGTMRVQDSFLLEPNRLRWMDPHRVAYQIGPSVQWGVVTPLESDHGQAAPEIVEHEQRQLPTLGNRVPLAAITDGRERLRAAAQGGWLA